MTKPVLAHFDMRQIAQHVPWSGLAVAADLMGIDYRRPELFDQSAESYKRFWTEVAELVDSAAAFLVTSGIVLTQFCDQLKQRIENGARVILTADVNQLNEINEFLSGFGLGTTSHRVLSSDSDSSTLMIQRQSECFVDQELLADVERIVFNSVAAVTFEREALPVLFAPESTWAVDLTSDLPVQWNRREVSCISRWQSSIGGAVVLLGGDIFWDVSRRRTNLSLIPGIQQNSRLASNLLRYATKLAVAEITPAQYCERAEKNLVSFVLTVLKLQHGTDWWIEGVPLNIRQECAKRQEEEARRRFPKEAYLNLIDLKTIMEKNWPVYQQYFKKVGNVQAKDKALSWLDKFNEIRRLAAHPLKAHIAGHSFTASEIDLAKAADLNASLLLNALPQQS